MNRHVISVLLENEPGALSRVVNLFSARGYNIEFLDRCSYRRSVHFKNDDYQPR